MVHGKEWLTCPGSRNHLIKRWEVRVRQEDAKRYPFSTAGLRAWAVAYRLLDTDA